MCSASQLRCVTIAMLGLSKLKLNQAHFLLAGYSVDFDATERLTASQGQSRSV